MILERGCIYVKIYLSYFLYKEFLWHINITVAIQYFFLFIICKNKRDIPSIGFTILLILKD